MTFHNMLTPNKLSNKTFTQIILLSFILYLEHVQKFAKVIYCQKVSKKITF